MSGEASWRARAGCSGVLDAVLPAIRRRRATLSAGGVATGGGRAGASCAGGGGDASTAGRASARGTTSWDAGAWDVGAWDVGDWDVGAWGNEAEGAAFRGAGAAEAWAAPAGGTSAGGVAAWLPEGPVGRPGAGACARRRRSVPAVSWNPSRRLTTKAFPSSQKIRCCMDRRWIWDSVAGRKRQPSDSAIAYCSRVSCTDEFS